MADILIVEDEQIVALHIQATLRTLGHQVVGMAASGTDAIEIATQTNPDLALMDIHLQGNIDGIHTAEEMYNKFRIPVIYVTAHAEGELLQRAKLTSLFGYIIKPFQRKDLQTSIEVALHRHQIEHQRQETLPTVDEQQQLHHLVQFYMRELELLTHLKQEFMNTVSHELRTPLTNMKMAIEMVQRLTVLLKSAGSDVEVAEQTQRLWQRLEQYCRVLHDEWQREFELIDNLLQFKQLEHHGIDQFVLTPIALQQWLPELVQRFSDQATRNRHTLICKIEPFLPTVRSHIPSLERIITELVANAFKYTPAGQTILIRATQKNQQIQLSVTNTGVEISQDEQVQIFHPFYRIPRSNPWNHSGTGLGLAFVKRLLLRLGGDIQVESAVSETSFIVTLPLHS